MLPNTLNTPERGDLVLIRRASSTASESQTSFLLIWDTPDPCHGVTATNSNVRAVDISSILPHQQTRQFLDTDLGRQVANASTPERAANVFRVAINTKIHNLRSSLVYSQVYSLAALLDQNSTFFLRPSAEAIRKVLLGDKCPNEHCENGLVAATHRAPVYQRYDLPTLTLAGNRSHLPMVCPACIPKVVAIESEKYFLVALRLDTGVRVTNEELSGIRANQVRLDDARLESGYEKIKVCPDVVWNVTAHGTSGWIVRRQGRWLQEMQRLSPMNVTGINDQRSAVEDPVVEVSRTGEAAGEGIPHLASLPRGTFGQLRNVISQAVCSICLVATETAIILSYYRASTSSMRSVSRPGFTSIQAVQNVDSW